MVSLPFLASLASRFSCSLTARRSSSFPPPPPRRSSFFSENLDDEVFLLLRSLPLSLLESRFAVGGDAGRKNPDLPKLNLEEEEDVGA